MFSYSKILAQIVLFTIDINASNALESPCALIFYKYAHGLNNKNQLKVGKTIWEYGGTGRRAGFKIRSLRWCGFN